MKRLVALLIAVMLAFCFIIPASAAQMPDLKVTIAADSQSVKAGDELKVTYGFENASAYPYGLAAFCGSLRYDSSALSIKSVDVAAPRANVMNNSKEGEFLTLYTFTSASKKPGFNTDGPFCTATFEVLDGASGTLDISVTFDTVTVTDYDAPELNFTVAFNSPSVRVAVEGGESSTPSETESEAESEAESEVEPEPESAPQSQVSSAPSSTVESTSSTSSTAAVDTSSTSSAPDTKFEDVADSGNDYVTDVFDDKGEIIEQTETNGKKPAGDNTGMIILICVVAAVVIGGAICLVAVLKGKKSKK